MYLNSTEAKQKQYKILIGVGVVSTILILILYKIGLFSGKSKPEYIIGSRTQSFEESTNKILSAWGQAGEALKFANLPSSGQGYLTVNAKVIKQDKSESKQDIQIFYREASKLNPAGFGIANKLRHGLHQHLKGSALGDLVRSKGEIFGEIAKSSMKKADEDMDDNVIDKDITLIFLHGQHYVSSTWQELGTLDYFANLGYKIYGIDMPGYGHSQKVTVKTNEWLIDVIQKLLSSQDEEGNIDQDGGEHHTDSHEKNEDAINNDVAPSTKRIHKIAIISPDISGSFTLDLLYHHQEKLGIKQGLKLEKFIPISIDSQIISSNPPKGNDVKICSIGGSDDVDLNDKIFKDVDNAQSFRIPGASKHVYLDNPDIFHQIIATFLQTDQCGVDIEVESEPIELEQGEQKGTETKDVAEEKVELKEARNPEEVKKEEKEETAN